MDDLIERDCSVNQQLNMQDKGIVHANPCIVQQTDNR